jgi:hypothetical protein
VILLALLKIFGATPTFFSASSNIGSINARRFDASCLFSSFAHRILLPKALGPTHDSVDADQVLMISENIVGLIGRDIFRVPSEFDVKTLVALL